MWWLIPWQRLQVRASSVRISSALRLRFTDEENSAFSCLGLCLLLLANGYAKSASRAANHTMTRLQPVTSVGLLTRTGIPDRIVAAMYKRSRTV